MEISQDASLGGDGTQQSNLWIQECLEYVWLYLLMQPKIIFRKKRQWPLSEKKGDLRQINLSLTFLSNDLDSVGYQEYLENMQVQKKAD